MTVRAEADDRSLPVADWKRVERAVRRLRGRFSGGQTPGPRRFP